MAGDTGPGNALMDDLIARYSNHNFDAEGKLAAKGKPHEGLIAKWMNEPYFIKPMPKSLDRDFFKAVCEQDLQNEGLNLNDGLATLNLFSAKAIATTIKQCPQLPKNLLVMGGGNIIKL